MAVGREELPVLSEVVEKIGFGLAQVRAIVLGGGVWLADGAELLLIGTVTRAVSNEWHLNSWQRGFVVSIVFVGILLGNMSSGPLGDTFGRRLPIVLSYLCVGVFSLLSAAVPNFWTLCSVRILVGYSFGVGQPAWNSLSTEITPTYWRIASQGGSQSLFVAGEIYSALLIYAADPQMKDLNWRMLLVYGSIPSFILVVLAYMFLHQSPSYLALHGHYDDAKAVLISMRNNNGKPADLSVEFRLPPAVEHKSYSETVGKQIGIVFGSKLLYSTITVVYSCLTLNCIFYGCLYAFPQVVTEVDMGSSPAMALLMGALWEIPGFIIGVICGMFMNRKPAMIVYLATVSLACCAFAIGGVNLGTHWYMYYLLHGGYIGIKMFACIGFIVVYQYAAEIYPTVARTTGNAICLAGGRLGGIFSPIAFEYLVEWTGSFASFFYMLAIMACLNFVLIIFLPFETAGKHLSDHHETDPLKEDSKA